MTIINLVGGGTVEVIGQGLLASLAPTPRIVVEFPPVIVGPAGPGVPPGGIYPQVLTKASNVDYDTMWADDVNVPPGGTTSQALIKQSDADYDAIWADNHDIPPGGTSGQVLTKQSSTNYDAAWLRVPNEVPIPEDFIPGCGDGIIDATEAIQALATQGGLARFPRGGVYRITTPIVAAAPIQWVFDGGAYLDTSELAISTTALTISGSQGAGIALTTDGLRGTFTFTVASAAGLSAGQHFRLASDSIWDPGRLRGKLGESNMIVSIDGNVIEVLEPLEFNYLVSDAATLFPWTAWENVVLENYRAVGRLDDSMTTGRVGILMKYLRRPQVYGMDSFRYGFGHLQLTDVISPRVDSIRTENDFANTLGYGITCATTTKGAVITGHMAMGMGHAISFGGGSRTLQSAAGQQRDCVYQNFDISGGNNNSTGGGRDSIDAHSTVIRGRIEGGTIRANAGLVMAGINLEGGSWVIRGVHAIGISNNALQYTNFEDYDATLDIEMTVDGCKDVINITESNANDSIGRITYTKIDVIDARRFTGQLVDWESTFPTAECLMEIRLGNADASASTDDFALIFLTGPKQVRIHGGYVRNRIYNGNYIVIISADTMFCRGPDWGVVEFESSPNTTASLVQFRSKDICRNGSFPDEDWHKGTGWTLFGSGGLNQGIAVKTPGVASNLSQKEALLRPFVPGKDYLVVVQMTAGTAGSVTPTFLGGTTVSGTPVTAIGVTQQTMTAVSGNNEYALVASADFDGTIEHTVAYEEDSTNIISSYQFPNEYWVKGTGWSITNNAAVHAPGAASDMYQITPNVNTEFSYEVRFIVTNRTAGSVTFKFEGGTSVVGTPVSIDGTATEILTPLSGNNQLTLSASSSFDGTIDSLTVKPIIPILGDPVSVHAFCTPVNTAKDFTFFDGCTTRAPLGRKRSNAATPVSSTSGSTFTATELLIQLSAHGILTTPADHYIEDIFIRNLTANAVTGGIRIGTSNGGTQVIVSQAVGANAFIRIDPADILIKTWNTNVNLYIQAVTAWNSAEIVVSIKFLPGYI